jgi:predicted RNA methylase
MASQLVIPGTPSAPNPALSQYDTPRDIARRMAIFAGIRPGMRVLEPSAGRGSLALAAREAGAQVACVELDAERARDLVAVHDFPTLHGDFLSLGRPTLGIDTALALMNPPFEDGQDLAHVEHALRFCPRVVALLPLGFLDGVDRHKRMWARNTLQGLAVLVRRFRAEGSEHGGQRPFGVFDIVRGQTGATCRMEWW